jgi:hypothetical protein
LPPTETMVGEHASVGRRPPSNALRAIDSCTRCLHVASLQGYGYINNLSLSASDWRLAVPWHMHPTCVCLPRLTHTLPTITCRLCSRCLINPVTAACSWWTPAAAGVALSWAIALPTWHLRTIGVCVARLRHALGCPASDWLPRLACNGSASHHGTPCCASFLN